MPERVYAIEPDDLDADATQRQHHPGGATMAVGNMSSGGDDRSKRMRVPARVVSRFEPVAPEAWRRMDNNAKAKWGKAAFLGMPGALDATSEQVRGWLDAIGLAVTHDWVEVAVAPGIAPRYMRVGYSSRCVDAFLDGRGSELKVSGSDGVCGLTVAEELLLRSGKIDIFAVNPVRGLIGRMDVDALLNVPRRLDGTPVGEARVEWEAIRSFTTRREDNPDGSYAILIEDEEGNIYEITEYGADGTVIQRAYSDRFVWRHGDPEIRP
jgi:hypothetical protein